MTLDFDWASNQDWIGTAAAVITAAATLVLARLTFVLARATNKLADLTSSPFCVLTFEGSPATSTLIDQVVRNTGTGTAFDIEVRLDPTLKSVTDTEKAEDWRRISILTPGQKLAAIAGRSTTLCDQTFKVHVSWSARPSSQTRQEVVYSCRAAPHATSAWKVKTEHDLVNQVEEMRGDIKSLGDALLRVIKK